MLRRLLLCLLLLPWRWHLADAPKLVHPGELTWGSSPTFMPFEFMKDGKATGFDVDLMADLAKRIGLAEQHAGDGFRGHHSGDAGRADRCGRERDVRDAGSGNRWRISFRM